MQKNPDPESHHWVKFVGGGGGSTFFPVIK